MKCRVYLAGASRELPRVLRYVRLLEASGLVVLTYRWWDAVAAHGVDKDSELTKEEARRHASADLRGVESADVLWCLWPEVFSVAAPLELGYALGRRTATVVSGAKSHECIFTALADYRDTSDDLGLIETLRIAKAHYTSRRPT